MYQNTKSATTAGLLGIFLGAFGAHNWYLGEKTKGIIHVCMMGGGLLVQIVASAILPNVLSLSALLTWASIIGILGTISALAMSASGIWGLVEGITILTQGDAGLARKGYPVATPQMPPQQNYGQPMNQGMPNQGYNNGFQQPYYGQPMNQPMPGQPMPNQPMPNQPMQPNMPNMEQPSAQPGQPQNNNMDGSAYGQQ